MVDHQSECKGHCNGSWDCCTSAAISYIYHGCRGGLDASRLGDEVARMEYKL
jgi:hypothetical protein